MTVERLLEIAALRSQDEDSTLVQEVAQVERTLQDARQEAKKVDAAGNKIQMQFLNISNQKIAAAAELAAARKAACTKILDLTVGTLPSAGAL